MGRDIRQDLYKNYVSKFKTGQHQGSQKKDYYYESFIINRLYEMHKDSEILELGCGNGLFLDFLSRKGFEKIEGIDISKQQIDLAKGLNLNVQVADAFSFLTDTQKKYDYIFALDFIEHFKKEELNTLLQYIKAALNKNGKLIMQTPNGMGLFPNYVIYGDLTHFTIFNPNSLKQLLLFNNFKNIIIIEGGPNDYGLKGKFKKSIWWFIKKVLWSIKKIESGKSQKLWHENMICICNG